METEGTEFCDELPGMIEAGRQACVLIAEAWKRVSESMTAAGSSLPSEVQFKIKSNTSDLQTKTDTASEAVIAQYLRALFPSHLIIGEETTAASQGQFELSSAPTFIIDPIDGTTNFVHNAISCSVLIAFARDREIVAGVTLDPIQQELFFAERGKGAWHVGDLSGDLSRKKRLRTSGCQDIRKAVICTDVGCQREPVGVGKFLEFQRKLLLEGQVQSLRIIGSCGLGLAYVAAGRFDAFIEDGSLSIWDFAPGKLLVSEASGFVCDPSGGPLDLCKSSVAAYASREFADSVTNLMSN